MKKSIQFEKKNQKRSCTCIYTSSYTARNTSQLAVYDTAQVLLLLHTIPMLVAKDEKVISRQVTLLHTTELSMRH